MLRQAGSPARVSPVRTRTVGVVFALGAERSSLHARGAMHASVSIALYQSGPGLERARVAARRAIDEGAEALVSWGLAAGLTAGLEAGHVLVPARVRSTHGAALATDAAWRAVLVDALSPRFKVHGGDLLSADGVLATAEAKAAAARASGAAAADMESHAIVAAAEAAGLPAAVVRVVADEAGDRLPVDVERWIDAAGRMRPAALWRLAAAPSQWPPFLRLARRSRRALATLAAVGDELTPAAFCRGGEAEIPS